MKTKKKRVRPLAICVVRRGDEILVSEGYDASKQQRYYRPLGGAIDFGETGQAAAARELQEEIAKLTPEVPVPA